MWYLDCFPFVALLGTKLLERRRRHENNKRHQIGLFENLERLRVQIENAKLSSRNDSPNGVEGRSIVSFFVFTVFDKLAIDDVGLKLSS